MRVDAATFRAWFPTMMLPLHRGAWMSVDSVVDEIDDHFSGRYGITRRQIERTLLLLFEVFKPHHGPLRGESRWNLKNELLSRLRNEAQSHPWAWKDLRSTRHTFIVLAHLATDHASELLIDALSSFWPQAQPIVEQYEQPHQRDEWYRAAAKVEQLGDPHTYAGWPRSRASHTLGIAWPGHRARSAPAVRHGHHHPEMRLTMPTFTNSAWASPMIAPVTFPRVDYPDDLENIQYQQQEMSVKLDNVDEKLDLLMTGFF